MRHRTGMVALAFVFSIIAASPFCSAAEPARLPLPDGAAVSKSRQLIRSAYEAEYQAARRSRDPASLMAELEGSVGNTTDPVRQYALLSEAETLARQHNDLAKALAIIDKRASLFEEDGLKLQADMLQGLAGPRVSGDAALLNELMHTATQAAVAERFEIATDLAKAAVSVAKAIDRSQKVARRPPEETTGLQLIKAAQELQTRLNDRKKAFTAYREAGVILEKQPDDPQANAAVGTYLCLLAQNWEKGLPYLAKNKIYSVGILAAEEVALRKATPPDPAKMFLLADKWWNVGLTKETIGGRDAIRLHAASLYSEVLPHLKDPLEKRLAETRGKPFKDQLVGLQPQGNEVKQAVGIPQSVENSVHMQLRLIPAGTFLMGTHGNAENPLHEVRITKPFYLGVTEVTNTQWKAVMGDIPSKWKEDDRPVEQVSWDEAIAFCRKLSELPAEKAAGRAYRLPTEAEWEYACRAGTKTRFSFGDDEAALGDYGWFANNSGRERLDAAEEYAAGSERYWKKLDDNMCQSHPVGKKQPNSWGLHDMHGNVIEWCNDWYGNYSSDAMTDPLGPSGGSKRVVRDGSWCHAAGVLGSAARNGEDPSLRWSGIGFRVAMDRVDVSPVANEVFLSDLQERNLDPPVEAGAGFSKQGKFASGEEFRVEETLCPKGILLSASTNDRRQVTYSVPPGSVRFRSNVGIQNNGTPSATALIFKVLDEHGKELWVSDAVASGRAKKTCDIELGGTTAITLVTECPGSCWNANGIWVDPRFVR